MEKRLWVEIQRVLSNNKQAHDDALADIARAFVFCFLQNSSIAEGLRVLIVHRRWQIFQISLPT